jgi:hypothetical protein
MVCKRLKIIVVKSLIILLMVFSVLQIFSVVTINLTDSFIISVSPYWMLGTIILPLVGYLLVTKKFAFFFDAKTPKEIKLAMGLLFAFVVYCILSSFILPHVFQGVDVIGQRRHFFEARRPIPLVWSFSNLGQSAYLFLNFGIFIFIVYSMIHFDKVKYFFNTFLIVGAIATGFGIFQHISVLYFPNQIYEIIYAITHNNPIYASYPSSYIRANSFFGEPSFYSGYAVAIAIMALNYFVFSKNNMALLLAGMGFYGALTALSTTGFASLVINLSITIAIVLIWYYKNNQTAFVVIKRLAAALVFFVGISFIFQQEENIINRVSGEVFDFEIYQLDESISKADRLKYAGFFSENDLEDLSMGIRGVMINNHSDNEKLDATPVPPTPDATPSEGIIEKSPSLIEELRNQTLEKGETFSFKDRLFSDKFSLTSVLPATFFMGAGWGSNRSSSFFAYLISNTGLIGFLLFVGFLFSLLRLYMQWFQKLDAVMLSVAAGTAAYLVALFGALPDLSWPAILWMLLGMLVAGFYGVIEPWNNTEGHGNTNVPAEG